MVKKALVTGASEGIGRALAIHLAAEGYQITGVARSGEKLQALVGTLGTGHDIIVADLADEGGQRAVLDALRAGNYALLVNNAGIGASGAFSDLPVERQLAVMRLNNDALVRLSHGFLEGAKPGDALINVSSVLAFLPMPGLGIYSASKSFVTAFSESLWYEQRKRGVYVMALHPGMTATDFQIHAGGTKSGMPSAMAQTPEQVAEATIHALRERKEPVVISGKRNMLFVALSKLLPRKALIGLMGQSGHKK